METSHEPRERTMLVDQMVDLREKREKSERVKYEREK